jgi:hypothetical protein
MPDEVVVITDGKPKKKRGRPPKSPLPPVTDGNAGESKPSRPACEKKPQEYEHRKVVWGIRAENPKFKQKGIAVLHKESEGDMVLLMPVTDDGEGGIRWRYRFVGGGVPRPYSYEMIPLEPEQGYNLGDILIQLGTALKDGVKEWFGSVAAAQKTSDDFLRGKQDSSLGDKIRKAGGVF